MCFPFGYVLAANDSNMSGYLKAHFSVHFNTHMVPTMTKGISPFPIPGGGASHLQLASYGGWFVYEVWQQQVKNNNSDIFIVVSQNGGRNYSQPINLTSHTPDLLRSINPHVGAFADDVYVTWEGINLHTNKSHVYLVNSTDGGTSFGSAINLNENPQTNAVESTLLVDKDTGKLLVGWVEPTGPSIYCGARC
jgi:hypothetical protein